MVDSLVIIVISLVLKLNIVDYRMNFINWNNEI